MKSAKGKTGEKAVFSQCGGDETTMYYDRAMKKRTICDRQHHGAHERRRSTALADI